MYNNGVPGSPSLPPNEFGRPLPKTFQSNTIVPNKSTMIEEDDDMPDDNDDEDGDAFGLEGAAGNRESRASRASKASKRSTKASEVTF